MPRGGAVWVAGWERRQGSTMGGSGVRVGRGGDPDAGGRWERTMRRAGARAPDEGTEQHLAVRAGLAMGPPATQEEGKEFAFAGKALGWASGMLPFGSLLTSFFFLVQGPPDAWSREGVLVAG